MKIIYNKNLSGYGAKHRVVSIKKYCEKYSNSVQEIKLNISVGQKIIAIVAILLLSEVMLRKRNERKKSDRHPVIAIYWYSYIFSPFRVDVLDLVDSNELFYKSLYSVKPNVFSLLKLIIFRAVEQKLIKITVCFVSGSRDTQHLRKQSTSQVYHVSNANLFQNFNEVESTKTFNDLGSSVGYIADFNYKLNLSSLNQIQFFIDIITNRKTKVILAGSGSDRTKHFCENNYVEKTGKIEDIYKEFYDRCGCILLPTSIGTSVPNKYYEALNAGKIIFASDYFLSCLDLECAENGLSKDDLGVYHISDVVWHSELLKVTDLKRVSRVRLLLIKAIAEQSMSNFNQAFTHC